MLNQMSVWVVVVALGLVLNYRLPINSRKLKNGNGNYYLTGKLIQNNKKTAGNNLWSNSTNTGAKFWLLFLPSSTGAGNF